MAQAQRPRGRPRRLTQAKPVDIVLEPRHLRALDREANDTGRSRSEVVRRLIEQVLLPSEEPK